MHPPAVAWFTVDRQGALVDYWSVYEANVVEIEAAALVELAAHPVFGPLLRETPEEVRRAQSDGSKELLRRAILDGAWADYQSNMALQGMLYASMGIPLQDWHDLVRMMHRAMVPRLVAAYIDEPARLAEALLVMQDLLDRSLCELAVAYLETKEADLRASEQRLSTTLDSIGDAVITTDPQGRVLRLNPVAEVLTGWSLAEATGRPLSEVFHVVNEHTGLAVESPVDRVMRHGTVVGLANHTLLLSRDGTARPIADSGAPIRRANGEIQGVVLVFRDQSAERAAEDERARALILEVENKRVLEANRLKGEFLASVSHELRTPLNAIIGFAELIHDGYIRQGQPEFEASLADILSSGQHLLRLINELLDLSKVDAGKIELYCEEIDLRSVIVEVVSTLRPTAMARRIGVGVDVDERIGRPTLDAARLRQVLYNYLSNALKFTAPGGVVTVRALPVDDGRFRLEVEDTGIGIAPENLSRLFVAFEQLDPGPTRPHGGTGLGLALTRKLVEAQGGEVGVESHPGKGSRFYAVLPRQLAEEVP